ncbi:MAG: CBS domain-containing protein [Nitrososphaerales archaeon]
MLPLHPSDNVEKVIDTMITKNVGSVVVEDGKVVGILRERDILKKIKDIDIDGTLISEVMSSPVLTVMPDMFITEALSHADKKYKEVASNEEGKVGRDSNGNRHPLLVLQGSKRVEIRFCQ